jgi:putative peptidoglycan lipid II flippase
VTSLAAVIFPSLSRSVATNDRAGFSASLTKGITASLLVAMLCIVLLGGLAELLVRVIYQRGHFLPADTTMTARVLAVYVLGLPGASISLILLQAVYALRLPRVRVFAGAMLLPTAFGLGRLLTPMLGIKGIALAHAFSFTLLAGYLGWTLRARLPGLRRLAVLTLRGSVATVCGYLVAMSCVRLAQWTPAASMSRTVFVIVVAGGVALSAFGFCCKVLGISETDDAMQMMWQRAAVVWRGQDR